jgi:hypothetical protein
VLGLTWRRKGVYDAPDAAVASVHLPSGHPGRDNDAARHVGVFFEERELSVRNLTLGLVVVAAVALAGCSSNSATPAPAATEAAAAATEAPAAASPAAAPVESAAAAVESAAAAVEDAVESAVAAVESLAPAASPAG